MRIAEAAPTDIRAWRMTKRGDYVILTTYNQKLEEILKKHSHTSYLRAATMPRSIYKLSAPAVPTTGERMSKQLGLWATGSH